MDDQNTTPHANDAPQTDSTSTDTPQDNQTPPPSDPITQPQDAPSAPATEPASVATIPENQPAPTDHAQPTDSQPAPTDQAQPADNQPTSDDNSNTQQDYIENVGGSVIDLLEDVNESDDLIQTVASEMKIDINKVKSILSPLIDKIHQGQVTIEELALIMAAPVVDEEPEENDQPNPPTNQQQPTE